MPIILKYNCQHKIIGHVNQAEIDLLYRLTQVYCLKLKTVKTVK